jgi:predicted dehydrogenase
VLCEKPLSRHPDEVEAAFDVAERTGRLLSEAFMWRHNPQAKRAKQLVDEGAIGELRLVRSTFSYSLYDEDNIRLRTDLEGGALMDVGCYNVSGSRLFGGEPEHVHGEAWFGPTGTDWVFAGTMRFPNDVVASFDCGTAMPNRDELEAIGSEGSLFMDDPWHSNAPVIEVRRADGVERIEIEPQDSYRLELENVSAAARGEAELLLGREDAVGQARALEALHESATRGERVKL